MDSHSYALQGLETLEAARDRIATPECWTKGAYARDSSGNPVPPWGAAAVCWSIRGSLIASQTKMFVPAGVIRGQIETAFALYLPSGFSNVEQFNDNYRVNHNLVLSVLNKVIEHYQNEMEFFVT